ncbi:MAG: multiheme c-type cytochrome [Phycisphaerae bacterium]
MLRAFTPAMLMVLVGCRSGANATSHGQAPIPAPVPVKPFRIPQPDVVLLITGGTNGMMEVCNCVGPMPGGLARRSGLVRSYRAAFRNTFLIDTGDVFWVEPEDLRNEFVLKGYARIGYDAVVLGDQEWAAKADRLRGLAAAGDLTFLSTTVTMEGAEFAREVTRPMNGVKLAVVSDVRGDAFRFVPSERRAKLSLAEPSQLAGRIRRLKEAGYLVVVVAHMEESVLEAAASTCRADLILRAHTSRSDRKLRRIAGKPVVKVGGFETVGVVAIKAADGAIADLDYRVEVVDTAWPLDGRLIQTYQAYAHAAMRQALDAPRKKGLAYVSSAECGRCHRQQYAAWRAGPHARAYKGLARVRRTGDPSCLMCHTTGFGTESGFYTMEKTPHMAGVNCQSCHRFTEPEHQRKDFTVPRLKKDVCTTCHTPVTSPKFDFRLKLPKVRCPQGRPVNDAGRTATSQ